MSECAAGVYDCPYGMTTTEVIPLSTSVPTITSVGHASELAYPVASATEKATSTAGGTLEKVTSTAAGATGSALPSAVQFTGGAARIGYGGVGAIVLGLWLL